MNKVLASLLMIGVVAAMAGAGTFAYYSDTATSVDNTFTAGTLDLVLYDNGGIPVAMGVGGNVAPGDTNVLVNTMNLTNAGSIGGNLTASVTNVTDAAGIDSSGDLSPVIEVTISNGVVTYTDYLTPGTNLTNMDFGALASGSSQDITVEYSIDGPSVGNEIQGDSVEFDIVFDLNQA